MSTQYPHSADWVTTNPVWKWWIPVQASMVSGCVQPMLVYRRWSYVCWVFCQWFRKGPHSSKWGCTGINHEITRYIRREVNEIIATVSFGNQNKTISTFSSNKKTIATFALNFCQLESTNVGNKVSRLQSFPSIILWEWQVIKIVTLFMEHPV